MAGWILKFTVKIADGKDGNTFFSYNFYLYILKSTPIRDTDTQLHAD